MSGQPNDRWVLVAIGVVLVVFFLTVLFWAWGKAAERRWDRS